MELLHSGNRHNLQTSFLIATTQRDKKGSAILYVQRRFQHGPHTISALSLWIFCRVFFFAVSNLSVSFPPGLCLFIHAHSLCVCLSRLFHLFICLRLFSLSLSLSLSLCLCLEEYSHHTLATDLTGNSFNVFQQSLNKKKKLSPSGAVRCCSIVPNQTSNPVDQSKLHSYCSGCSL